jgi:uncharacterized repeat protein (TIGR03803 family)
MHNTILLTLILSGGAGAATAPRTLHAFGVGSQLGGSTLYASLLLDAAGNLYGTAEFGGQYNRGVVFRLSPKGNTWTETVLHSFKGGGADGETPHASVIMDSAGNLYGTTIGGGSSHCTGGCGIVFQLTPATIGPWTETVLHQFQGGTDASGPYSGLVFDAAGNLYGATTGGGASGQGAVYKLTPFGGGVWDETVIYSFKGTPDGASAWGVPVFDAAGNLYGTTNGGGANRLGTVYELTLQTGGAWSEQVLHSFHGASDGSDIFEGLTIDGAGNLYGAAETGGSASCGVAFELSRNSSGVWTETILHTFLGLNAQDGENPNGLILDHAGNIYGTTVGGGTDNPGTIFKLSAGTWTETILYNFTGGNDGAYPSVPLIMDAAGNLYGTTLWGGPAGDTVGGVAFELTP